MRTFVFIDGFNLYYTLFVGRRNIGNKTLKWLDLESLTRDILSEKYKKNNIVSLKYYTANVSGKLDSKQPERQNVYLNAIARSSNITKIVRGKFSTTKIRMKKADCKGLVNVIKQEEKDSDVNLSVHMVHHAHKNDYDVAVVITNDTDMSEAFKIVSRELEKKIILIHGSKVKPANSLKKYCIDTLKITHDHLKRNQFPDYIEPKIRKPEKWKSVTTTISSSSKKHFINIIDQLDCLMVSLKELFKIQ